MGAADMSLDQATVNALAIRVFEAVRERLDTPPHSPDNVWTVLNAIAGATAIVLCGTGNDPNARRFFDSALDQQIAATMADIAAATPGEIGHA